MNRQQAKHVMLGLMNRCLFAWCNRHDTFWTYCDCQYGPLRDQVFGLRTIPGMTANDNALACTMETINGYSTDQA